MHERLITNHMYSEGVGVGCAFQYGTGEWRERCGCLREQHGVPDSARHTVMPIDEQEELAANSHFIPLWIDPAAPSQEDSASESTGARRQAEIVYQEQQARVAAASGIDRRPHSRACGISPHDHGQACSTNCPTCHGQETPEPEPFATTQRYTVSVYTTNDQYEQPYIINHVVDFKVDNGVLVIECDAKEGAFEYQGHCRYLPEKWRRFEVSRV